MSADHRATTRSIGDVISQARAGSAAQGAAPEVLGAAAHRVSFCIYKN